MTTLIDDPTAANEYAGGSGSNTLDYASTNAQNIVTHVSSPDILIDLSNGRAINGFGLLDTFTGFQNATSGDGADILIGSSADNVLSGGSGADIFVVTANGGHDTITDFSHADGDKIDLTAWGTASFAQVNAVQSGSDTVITVGPNQVTLQNVTSLTPSDFVFANGYATVPVNAATTVGTAFFRMVAGQPAYQLSGSAALTVQGTLAVEDDSPLDALVATYTISTASDPTFHVTGTVTVYSAGSAQGFESASVHAEFTNDYEFSVLASGAAAGVHLGQFGSVTNNRAITVTSASGQAEGIVVDGYDTTVTTSGSLSVQGSAAIGIVSSGGSVSNTGTITATNTGGGQSEGVAIHFSVGDLTDVRNSGTITADDAIVASSISSSSGFMLDISNSGTINGAIRLDQAPATNIANTGAIHGDIHFGGSGYDNYDGRGGTLTGGLYLGGGTDTAYLGSDGETVHGGTGDAVVFGGAGADTFLGGSGDDTIDGGGGADVLDGGGGVNTLSYGSASSGVTVSLAVHTAQDTVGGGIDTLSNFQNLTGSGFDDHLTGDGSNNIISGGGGNDVMDGGGGVNTVSYADASGNVDVSLALQGAAQSTGQGSDTLTNFQNLTGSRFSDTLEGDSGNNVLDGGAGIGTDTVTYAHASAGVTVSLMLQGQAQNTVGAGTDTLSNFENLTGSAFNDTLEGDGNDNVLNGGGGTNTVSYAHAASRVTVSLASQGQAQGTSGAGIDTLSNFQNLDGSAFNDRLTDDSHDNVLTGGGGADTFVFGGGGHDVVADFSHAEGDTIDLTTFGEFFSFADVEAHAVQSGADTVIATNTGSVTLRNVQLNSLTLSDFHLSQAPWLQVNYDASVNSAPAGFKTAVQAAVAFFNTTFDPGISVNIDVGWGEVHGDPLDAKSLAESEANFGSPMSYQDVRKAVIAADDGAVAALTAALPADDPTGGAQFLITFAEAKALGLSSGTSDVDGYVGLSSSTSFTFDPNNRAVAGKFDAIGALEHELSEVLGRRVFADESPGSQTVLGPLDLFRSAPGVPHDFQPGLASFSLDGFHALEEFNDGSNGGDAGDWASNMGYPTDAFDAFGRPGVVAPVSSVDLLVMQALGYPVMSTGPTAGPGLGGTARVAAASGGTLTGGPGDDWLEGQGGNDTLHGGGGWDYLDGGAGLNTATYDGVYREYTVGAGAATVSGGPEGGTDDLANIQRIQFVDGYLATSTSDTAGQVYRLYEATLDRAPDPVGLANWVHDLNNGASLQSVVDGFVGSTEFQQTYGALDNAAFVTLLYHNVLHRDPDAGGLNNWVGLLNSGHTRAEVVTGFSESSEDINTLAAPVQSGLWIQDTAAAEAARLYDAVLSRLPDATGLANWTHLLESGTTLLQATQGFVGSAEFQAVYGSLNDSQFVQLLYQNTLHREADPTGLANWTSLLAAGHSRAEVVLGFSESGEHIANTSAHVDYGVWTV